MYAFEPPSGKTLTPFTNLDLIAIMTPTITPAHLDQYDTRGFFVLERVIPPAHLELLRRAADEAVAARIHGNEVGDAEGTQLMDNDPGDIIEVAAGSVVVFSALTLHGSGANLTQAPRRALNIAYTQLRFADAEDDEVTPAKGVEFIKDGQITAEAARRRTAP